MVAEPTELHNSSEKNVVSLDTRLVTDYVVELLLTVCENSLIMAFFFESEADNDFLSLMTGD